MVESVLNGGVTSILTPEEQEYEEMQALKAQAVIEAAKQFKVLPYDDFNRCAKGAYWGGFALHDDELHKRQRSAAKEFIKQIGKKLMNGKFDLTRVGFPIKCMGPLSILEQVPVASCSSPIYLNYAAGLSDPVERMRLVMVNSISYYYLGNIFEKPLNPILGETFQAIGGDGSGVFAEQTSHHPPTSHFYVHGPNGAYFFHGW